eukprot:2613460-Rhodomonas_salina.3
MEGYMDGWHTGRMVRGRREGDLEEKQPHREGVIGWGKEGRRTRRTRRSTVEHQQRPMTVAHH